MANLFGIDSLVLAILQTSLFLLRLTSTKPGPRRFVGGAPKSLWGMQKIESLSDRISFVDPAAVKFFQGHMIEKEQEEPCVTCSGTESRHPLCTCLLSLSSVCAITPEALSETSHYRSLYTV
jgi:hypothetical protein